MSTGMALYRGPGLWETILGPGRRSTPPPPFNRNTLVIGVDRPTLATTGVLPGVPRPNHLYPNDGPGRYYVMSPGETISDFVLHGGLRPAAGCHAYNGEILGFPVPVVTSSTGYGLVNLQGGTVDDFLGEHLSIVPQVPSPAFTGVRGAGGLFRFCHVAHVQDGSMAYSDTHDPTLVLEFHQSLFEHPLMTNPDPTRGDGDQTHADVGCQQQGASVIFRGCYVIGWDVTADGPYAPTELNGGGIACWMITGDQTGAGDRPQTCIFDKGWMRGGNIPINITPTLSKQPVNGVHITDSKIGFGLHNYGGLNPYKHIVRPSAMGAALNVAGSIGWNFDTETTTGPLVIANT